MKKKSYIFWLCEKHVNMVPIGEYMSRGSRVTSIKIVARWFFNKQTCSNQCPPGFFPTEHHD